jgi:hypothetical protein
MHGRVHEDYRSGSAASVGQNIGGTLHSPLLNEVERMIGISKGYVSL